MKTRIFQFFPVVLSLAALYFARFSYQCMYTSESCYGTWISHIYPYFTHPLYNFALYFLPLAIVLVFIPHRLFFGWLKHVMWMLPLAVILISLTPSAVSPSNLGIDFTTFYRNDAARLSAQLITLVSIVVLVVKYWRSRPFTPRIQPPPSSGPTIRW